MPPKRKSKSPKACTSNQVRNPKTGRCVKIKVIKSKPNRKPSVKSVKSIDDLYSKISVHWINTICVNGVSIPEGSFVPEELRRHFESDPIGQSIVKFAYPLEFRDSEEGSDIYFEKALVFRDKKLITQITKEDIDVMTKILNLPKLKGKALFKQTEYDFIARHVIEQQIMFDEKHEQQEKIFYSKQALTAIHKFSEMYLRFLIVQSSTIAKQEGKAIIKPTDIQRIYLSTWENWFLK